MSFAAAHTTEPSRGAHVLLGALVAAVAALLYLPALSGALVYDDLLTVARNPLVTSLANVPEMFARSMWGFYSPESEAAVGYWRPLASVVLAAGYEMGATDPRPYHALSIALHALAAAAAYHFAWRWTRRTFVALACGLLFAVHPVHVESVAWISAQNDPLFCVFALLALTAFLRWRDVGSRGAPWLAGVLLLLALLSKEIGLAVAPIAVALDVARARAAGEPLLARDWKRAYLPLALALAVYYAARVAVFGSAFAGFDKVTTEFGVSASRLLALRVELLGGFAKLLVAPYDLRFLRPFVPSLDRGSSAFLVPLAWSAGTLALAGWAWWKRERVALGFMAFALIAIAPLVVRPQALGAFPLSDRYVYLAVLGVSGLIAYTAWRFLPRVVAFALVGVIAIAFAWKAHARIGVWRDEETLFATAAAETPRSPYVQWCLGRVLLQRYRHTQEIDALRSAHQAFTRALALGLAAQRGDGTIFAVSNDYLQANVGLGWSLLHLAEIDGWRDYQIAADVFHNVIERYPTSEEGWTGLAVAQIQLGELDAAETSLEKALAENGRFAEAHTTLGILRSKRGDWAGARAAFDAALVWRPNHLETLLLRGGAEERAGDDASAAKTFELAASAYPNDGRPLVSRGTLAAKRGDLDTALIDFERALALRGDLGIAWLQKGRVLAQRGETHGAERAFIRAAELLPTSFEANYNAGAALTQTEGVPAAMPFLVRAYELRPRNAQGDELRTRLLSMPIQSANTFVALATADADRGSHGGALEWLARAIAIDPSHGGAHFLKGGMLRVQGDQAGAYAELKRACELLPDSYLAHEAFGGLCVELDRRDEAVQSLERALAIARASPIAVGQAGEAAFESLRARIDELR